MGPYDQLGTLITPVQCFMGIPGLGYPYIKLYEVKLCRTVAIRTSSRVQFSFI